MAKPCPHCSGTGSQRDVLVIARTAAEAASLLDRVSGSDVVHTMDDCVQAAAGDPKRVIVHRCKPDMAADRMAQLRDMADVVLENKPPPRVQKPAAQSAPVTPARAAVARTRTKVSAPE